MTNGTDQQCCAAEICCDHEKAIQKLSRLLRQQAEHLSESDALALAIWLLGTFTLVPASWGLMPLIRQIQAHPYEGA